MTTTPRTTLLEDAVSVLKLELEALKLVHSESHCPHCTHKLTTLTPKAASEASQRLSRAVLAITQLAKESRERDRTDADLASGMDQDALIDAIVNDDSLMTKLVRRSLDLDGSVIRRELVDAYGPAVQNEVGTPEGPDEEKKYRTYEVNSVPRLSDKLYDIRKGAAEHRKGFAYFPTPKMEDVRNKLNDGPFNPVKEPPQE